MDLLESLARRRIQQSEEKIRDALILAAIGNPFAAETDARRLQERFQAKVGLTPRAAEATAAQVVETARQARAQHEAFTQGARPIAEAAAAATRPDRREKIWGDTIDFVSVSFLERGAQTARSVGRVAYRSGAPKGSGILIGANLFLTNNHVLESQAEADRFMLEFDYEQNLDGSYREVSQFELDSSVFIYDPVEGLDFTVVGVGRRISGPEPIEDFGFSTLSDARDKHMIGEFANIVQHPSGRYKEIVLRENRLVNRFEDALHYVADTEPGSSGSPVYNSEWQMIALHHWGGPWIGDTGDSDNDFEVNEGIRISSIVRYLRRIIPHQPTAVRTRLVDVLALGERTHAGTMPGTAPLAPRQQAQNGGAGLYTGPQISPDGRVSWIVPVELSVRLPSLAGQGADAAAVAPSEPAVALAGPRRSEADDYANRRGYDPGFLRVVEVPLPRLRDSVRGDAARKLKVADGEDPFELKYHHFSVVMNRRRKLTFFTACNIDGATAKSIKRSTRAVSDLSATDLGLREAVDALEDAEADSWRHDLRLSREDYSGVEIYERQKVPGFPNPRSKQRILRMFQKGHLVRRLDPAWGTANQALEAELDTFHWTNAAPQVGFFNMGAADEDQPGTGGGKLWRAAENYVLRNAVDEDMPVTSFTGPIFRDDDRPYRNIQIPGSFFKVTIWEDEGTLRSLACIVDQSQVFREWPENLDAAPEAFLDPDELKRVRDFLSTVAEVEALTGIDFGEAVREADIRRGESPREVKSDDDLPFAGPVDDLTRINGLGPVFATRLRARGVTTFAQIAGWNEAEITNMDDRIVARGNIKRDDWVGQARKLAARDRPRRRHVRPEEILSGDLKWSDVTNPMEPPWNAIGALFDSNSRFVGTAWIAGSRTAICAAHMVHGAGPFSLELPGGAIEIEGDAILPSEFTGADREESKRVDIAVLQLAAAVTVPEIPLGDSWGSIGVVAGYFRDGGSLRFTNNAGLLGPENDDYLLHRADTEGGHSGSPILVESAGGVWSAVALHVGGLERHPLNVTRRNTALRLNFDRLKFLKENLS